jgi:YVTN family beta-propeller protein
MGRVCSRRRPFLVIIFTSILIASATVTAAQPFVYVGIHRSWVSHFPVQARLLKVDNLTGRTIASFQLDSSYDLDDIVIAPDGGRIFMSLNNSGFTTPGAIEIVDTSTMRSVGFISLASQLAGSMAISPDGAWLYVAAIGTYSNSPSVPHALLVIDTTSYTTATVSLTGAPNALTLSSSGARAYVTVTPSSTAAGLLAVIDTSTRAVVSTIPVGVAPHGLALSADGATAYVANGGSRTVSVIDTASGVVTREIPLPLVSGEALAPEELVLTSDGSGLYVKFSAAVLLHDLVQETFTAVHPSSGSYVGRPELSPDGTQLYLPTYRQYAADTVLRHRNDMDVVPAGDTALERTFRYTDAFSDAQTDRTAAVAFPPVTGCLFEVTDRNRAADSAGGTGVLTIPAPTGCTWMLDASTATFVTFTSPTTGTGPGTVSYSIPAYAGTSLRQDIVRVNGQDVRFSQIVTDITIDTYTDGSTIMDNPTISGWAVDPDLSVTTGTGIDAVHVWAYPNPGSGANPIFLGAAQYGVPRIEPLRLGYPVRFTQSGFTLATTLPISRYQIVVFAHRTRTNDFSLVRAIVVDVKQAASIDAPQNNATVSFPFVVGGWAIDPNSTVVSNYANDTGITKVEILATPASGGTTLVLGTAAYGGSRPDVAAVYGSRFYSCGFNFTARPGGGFTSGIWRIALRLTTDEGLVVTRDPITVTIVKQR